MNYSAFTMIEDDSRLASFFNSIMRELMPVRMFCAPSSFQRHDDIADFQDTTFANFCRYEVWMHGVVGRLRKWAEILDEYFTDFSGSWKYYAAAKRMEQTDEEATRDADYMAYSVISDLYLDGWKDIVQDTVPNDLRGMCADIITNSQVDMLEGLRKAFGGNVQAFKKVGGKMIPITQDEHALDMITRQVDAEDDVKRIQGICGCISAMCEIIKDCKYDDNNTDTLKKFRKAVDAMLEMDWNTLQEICDED